MGNEEIKVSAEEAHNRLLGAKWALSKLLGYMQDNKITSYADVAICLDRMIEQCEDELEECKGAHEKRDGESSHACSTTPDKPTLILIVGVAGSGKTTVGKLLAEQLGYVYLDKDTLTRSYTDAILALNSPTGFSGDRESDYYKANVRPLEYKTMLDVAEENLRLGKSVIISAPFLHEAKNRDWLQKELFDNRELSDLVRVKVLFIKSDERTMNKRIKMRDAVRDSWKLANWTEYWNSVKDFDITWILSAEELFVFNNSELAIITFDAQMLQLQDWVTSN